MLELFPEGFEEVDRAGGRRARRLHGRGRRGAALGVLLRRARAPTSRAAGRTAGARSTGRSRSAGSGSGRRGRTPDPDAARGRDRPGPRVRHRLASDDAALPRRAPGARARARCSTSAAARACSRSRPRCSAYAPVLGVDVEAPAVEATRENAARNGVERRGAARRRRRAAAARRRRRREHLARRGPRAAGARRRATSRHVRLPRSRSSPSCRATRTMRALDARRLGRRRLPRVSELHTIPRVATFTVDFLGCKVSHADAHEVREALLADGHAEAARRRRRRGDQHAAASRTRRSRRAGRRRRAPRGRTAAST